MFTFGFLTRFENQYIYIYVYKLEEKWLLKMLNGICFLINYLSFPTGHGSSNPLQLLASVERIQNLPKCCTLVKFDNAG